MVEACDCWRILMVEAYECWRISVFLVVVCDINFNPDFVMELWTTSFPNVLIHELGSV